MPTGKTGAECFQGGRRGFPRRSEKLRLAGAAGGSVDLAGGIAGVRRRKLLPLLSEAEHLHHSAEDQADQFRQLALRVGVGDFDKVFSDESF